MKIFLASFFNKSNMDYKKSVYNLESFIYFKDWEQDLIKSSKDFLLDSGAFTFLNKNKGNVDFNKYVEEYAKFINKLDIKHFFELDIDSIVGIKEVEKLRSKLEMLTQKKCIPVWHKSRGKEYFINLCKNYDYVAIGGIVTKEIRREEYKYFPWFIDVAHFYNCKIHGLGFTSTKELFKYNFDSVDSTAWKSGGRFGQIHKFNGRNIDMITKKGYRVKDPEKLDKSNFDQWCLYQKYMEGKNEKKQ